MRIWIEVQIYSKIDEHMASTLIRKSKTVLITDVHGKCNRLVYYVCCQDNTGTLCQDSCSNNHMPVLDFLQQIGNTEVSYSITIVKNIQKRAETYIKNIVSPNSDNYDLWLQWSDNGSVMLVGYLWPYEFQEINQNLALNKGIDYIEDKCGFLEKLENAVEDLKHLKPTVTLSNEVLEKDFQGHDDVIDRIEKQQLENVSEGTEMYPPSLITFYSRHSCITKDYDSYKNSLEVIDQIINDANIISTMDVIANLIVEPVTYDNGLKTEKVYVNYKTNIKKLFYVSGTEVNSLAKCLKGFINEGDLENMDNYMRILWYHIILDLWRSGSDNKWVFKREPREKHILPYSPSLVSIIDWPMTMSVIGPRDSCSKIKSDKEVHNACQKTYSIPLLKFLSGTLYRIKGSFSSQDVEFVDNRDLRDEKRKWIEVKPKDLGVGEPVWEWGNSKYVPQESWRTKFMKLPEEVNVNLAELTTWYRKESDPNVTIFSQDDGHLPQFIRLKDLGTLLVKKKKQSILLAINPLSENNCYGNKVLFKKWENDEDIDDLPETTHADMIAVFPTMTL